MEINVSGLMEKFEDLSRKTIDKFDEINIILLHPDLLRALQQHLGEKTRYRAESIAGAEELTMNFATGPCRVSFNRNLFINQILYFTPKEGAVVALIDNIHVAKAEEWLGQPYGKAWDRPEDEESEPKKFQKALKRL